MNKAKFFMTLVMLAIFVVMVGIAAGFPPEARAMPFVVGIPGIGLCLFQLFLDMLAARQAGPAAPVDTRNEFERAQANVSRIVGQKLEFDMALEKPQVVIGELPEEGERRREIILWACLAGLVAGIILFGFWPTIPVFLVLFLHYFAGKSWPFSLALGAAGATILFLVFSKGLGVSLHAGFITEALLDRFAGM